MLIRAHGRSSASVGKPASRHGSQNSNQTRIPEVRLFITPKRYVRVHFTLLILAKCKILNGRKLRRLIRYLAFQKIVLVEIPNVISYEIPVAVE